MRVDSRYCVMVTGSISVVRVDTWYSVMVTGSVCVHVIHLLCAELTSNLTAHLRGKCHESV